jgi:hypothetical protein
MNELLARAHAKKLKLSRADLQEASEHVKTNLVRMLIKLTDLLVTQEPDISSIAQTAKLTDVASKLFAWPAAKAIEISNPEDSAKQLHTAINLALIRTTPEQLRAKARLITANEITVRDEHGKFASS